MRPFQKYIPGNWYWIVGGDQTQVFSSAAAAYVPANDPVYQAWFGAGNIPTKIDTEALLWDVLAAQVPAGLPPANATAQDALKQLQVSTLDVATLKGLFNHENRIRTLEGKQAMTLQQFITAIKSLL